MTRFEERKDMIELLAKKNVLIARCTYAMVEILGPGYCKASGGAQDYVSKRAIELVRDALALCNEELSVPVESQQEQPDEPDGAGYPDMDSAGGDDSMNRAYGMK